MSFWKDFFGTNSNHIKKTPISVRAHEARPKPTSPKHETSTQQTRLIDSLKSEIKPEPKTNPHPAKEFLQVFKKLTYRHRDWDIWKDFILMFACALSNPVDKTHYDEREALYLQTINKYDKQEQLLFPELVAQTVMALELNPEQDFLGKIFMDLNLGSASGGQFFTPYHVCQLMAAVSMCDILHHVEENGYFTINDPCCGAGATLIAGVHEAKRQLEKVNLNFQNHIFVLAQDIDQTVALMCYIQLSLLGVAGYIKVGNSLTSPMSTSDTLDGYWFTMMYFSPVWDTRRLFIRVGDYDGYNPIT